MKHTHDAVPFLWSLHSPTYPLCFSPISPWVSWECWFLGQHYRNSKGKNFEIQARHELLLWWYNTGIKNCSQICIWALFYPGIILNVWKCLFDQRIFSRCTWCETTKAPMVGGGGGRVKVQMSHTISMHLCLEHINIVVCLCCQQRWRCLSSSGVQQRGFGSCVIFWQAKAHFQLHCNSLVFFSCSMDNIEWLCFLKCIQFSQMPHEREGHCLTLCLPRPIVP